MKTNPFRAALLSALFALPVLKVMAHPYASGVTNNAGTIQYILNEAATSVTVTFEDGSTLTQPTTKGAGSFSLTQGIASHTSYSIAVYKAGAGAPVLISADADAGSVWNSPRGVDVNKNAQLGYLFGRTYVGNSAVGGASPNDKGIGLYARNADFSDSPMGYGTAAQTTSSGLFSAADGNTPWRFTIAKDNTLYVGSESVTDANVWQITPDLKSATAVFSITGKTAGILAAQHGDQFGTPVTVGSIATGDLVLYTADPGMACPETAVRGPNTSPGSYNCIYKYVIGSGPLPWAHGPDYAYTVGLDSIAALKPEVTIGSDGKIICGFGRANLSNGNIQILDPQGTNIIYNSLHDNTDPWNGIKAGGAQVGNYAGVRVSPDGVYLASVDVNNGITVAFMTNGIPDESSIFGIANLPATANSRGMCWDAADNILVASSGQGLLRAYSLGLTTTAVTTNDATGTNGSFTLQLPAYAASIVTTTNSASQNYINNTVNPGVPTPAAFRVSLTAPLLTNTVAVVYALSTNSAVYGLQYTLNTGTNSDGVIIATNSVTFPANVTFPRGGNWYADIIVTPTATPVTGPTTIVSFSLKAGTTYSSVPPVSGSILILNTGPQLLTLSLTAPATPFNRSIPGDYANFLITRWGDLNGPGNNSLSITPTSYTVTNFVLPSNTANAKYGIDYLAGPQNHGVVPAGFPLKESPTNNLAVINVAPGVAVWTNIIGNPVRHSNIFVNPTNLTAVIYLGTSTNITNITATTTNIVFATGTNLTSLEGLPYTVAPTSISLTLQDNAVRAENVVLYSNSLTNADDSTNWTVTFASTNLGATTVRPVVITNYANAAPDPSDAGGSNNFTVTFGQDLGNDAIPQSQVMAALGWTSALKMTVNKDSSWPAPSAVNAYLAKGKFSGNYALRFNMYLSLNSSAINNPVAGNAPIEFAEFGVNHIGTNVAWKPTTTVTSVTGGNGPTNIDGNWAVIDASTGTITPADYDAFSGNTFPNTNSVEITSNSTTAETGVFKAPPFAAQNSAVGRAGGAPINLWVDVSMEVHSNNQNNVFVDNTQVLATWANANYTNGTVMLGYLDPIKDVGDSGSAFVYYSNLRVVEVSPAITNLNVNTGAGVITNTNLLVFAGTNITLSSGGTTPQPPITNMWVKGTIANALTTHLNANVSSSNTIVTTFSIPNITTANATNYFLLSSDSAGSITSSPVSITVVNPLVNRFGVIGATNTNPVTAVSGGNVLGYRWALNGTLLSNGAGRYGGVTTATLVLTNALATDSGTYTLTITNASASTNTDGTSRQALVTSNVWVFMNGVSSVVVTPTSNNVNWGDAAVFNVTASGDNLTYHWKKGAVNLVDGAGITGSTTASLTLSPVGFNSQATNYAVTVTNAASSVTSGAVALTVLNPPQPHFNATTGAGGSVVLSFDTTGLFETTNSWALLSSTVVQGPYTNTPAVFTGSGTNYQVTLPTNGDNMFYQLHHN